MASKKKILQHDITNGVAIVTLDTPGEKVNKLDEQLIDEFSSLLDSIEEELVFCQSYGFSRN